MQHSSFPDAILDEEKDGTEAGHIAQCVASVTPTLKPAMPRLSEIFLKESSLTPGLCYPDLDTEYINHTIEHAA